MVSWLFLLGCVEYEGGGAKGNDGSILDAQTLAVAQYAVHYKCTGDAVVVANGVGYFAECVAFYIQYAVATVHTWVACFDGVRYYSSFVVTAYNIVSFI